MILGSSCIIGCYLILYFSKSLYLDYFGLALFGVGQGIAYLAPIRNTCFYFPEKKGFVTGFIVTGYGISAVLLNIVIKYVVNPESLDTVDGFYTKEVYDNVKNYLLIAIIFLSSVCILSVAMQQKYEVDETDDQERNLDTMNSNTKDNSTNLVSNPTETQINVKDLILSKETLFFGFIAFCSYCKTIYIY